MAATLSFAATSRSYMVFLNRHFFHLLDFFMTQNQLIGLFLHQGLGFFHDLNYSSVENQSPKQVSYMIHSSRELRS